MEMNLLLQTSRLQRQADLEGLLRNLEMILVRKLNKYLDSIK